MDVLETEVDFDDDALARRVRVTTSRRVNLAQLSHELGDVGLVSGSRSDLLDAASEIEIIVADPNAAVTADELSAAIAAHEAEPEATREQQIATIVDDAPDWRTALKALAENRLL